MPSIFIYILRSSRPFPFILSFSLFVLCRDRFFPNSPASLFIFIFHEQKIFFSFIETVIIPKEKSLCFRHEWSRCTCPCQNKNTSIVNTRSTLLFSLTGKQELYSRQRPTLTLSLMVQVTGFEFYACCACSSPSSGEPARDK